MLRKPYKIGLLAAVLFFFGLFISEPPKAQAAASLYFDPATGTFTAGSTFTVSLYLNTGGQSVNAIEANLNFPSDKLQVVSPSAGKSLIQVWVSQPTYSNIDGIIKFQGAVPSPGINTSAGLISSVTFRVKSAGTASLKILDSSQVFLNDGFGTNILDQTTSGIYNLVPPPPAGPIVSSRTHPDQSKWYPQNTTIFEWVAEPNSQGFSYILSGDVVGKPDNISEGANTDVSYENIADGTHYFHIKSLRSGVWGGISTYTINIDQNPPAEFRVEISPGERTSNRNPIINFSTTDAESGVDHYELKIIPLEPQKALAANGETQLFIEAVSPYSRELDFGRHQVVLRAYDKAGNYTQAEKRLTVAKPLFKFIASDGLCIGSDDFCVGWLWSLTTLALILSLLGYFARTVWRWHRIVEEQLRHSPIKHPKITGWMEKLKEKQKEYKETEKFTALLILIVFVSLFNNSESFAQNGDSRNLSVEPPIVTLFPKNASNDEIVYLGGRAGAPEAKVLIYIQNLETGSTINYLSTTDKNGEWFYSFPKFFDVGKYVVWTQLQIGEELSPPSPQLNLTIARTAIQIGDRRFSFENLYFELLLVSFVAIIALLFWTVYHGYHYKAKGRKLNAAVREAEESIRRGFAILRKDIETELSLIHKAKLSKELSAEEKFREEKLLEDLEEVSRHIGREIWEIERAEMA